MKAAFSISAGRIAPVFDTANLISIIEAYAEEAICVETIHLSDDTYVRKAHCLAELGVESLVCGAISILLHQIILAYDIRVIAFVAGEVEEIIDAWRADLLWKEIYTMPGCRNRSRRFYQGKDEGFKEEGVSMNINRGGGRGKGRGQGSGSDRGQGGGRRQNPRGLQGGVVQEDLCVCPQCGQRAPHTLGSPCFNIKCPQCGSAMMHA